MKSHVTWALVGASVALLGFASLQSTDAAWSSSDSTDGAAVRTGHLRISGDGQMALDVSGLTRQDMESGDQAQIPLSVVNDSTVPVTYRLTGVAPAVGTTPPALNLRVARVSQESDCSSSEPDAPGSQLVSVEITEAETQGATLAVGATDVLCLTTTAGSMAPNLSGKYVFTFKADQLQAGQP